MEGVSGGGGGGGDATSQRTDPAVELDLQTRTSWADALTAYRQIKKVNTVDARRHTKKQLVPILLFLNLSLKWRSICLSLYIYIYIYI